MREQGVKGKGMDNGVARPSDLRPFRWWSFAADKPTIAGSEPVSYIEVEEETFSPARKAIVLETAWPLVINGQHWLTLLCTPTHLEAFVLGFLFNEGIIQGLDDVRSLRIQEAPEALIEVELRDAEVDLPQHRTLTSGCGGGITFVDMAVQRAPVTSKRQVTADQLAALMQMLITSVADEYREVGGFHTSGLSHGRDLAVVVSDIGRHNTLDKIAGECLLRGIPTRDAILLTTGRVSSEMLGKAARMEVPVVVTRNSPTSLAVELARAWHVTLVGYARGRRMHVYTGWDRIQQEGGKTPCEGVL